MSDRLATELIDDGTRIDGASLLVRCLAFHGVQHVFGVIGIPIVELGIAATRSSMNFYSMRNEQSASYAASAIGYLTGMTGVCLSVAGPGVVHALAGIANAWANRWPLVHIAAAIDTALLTQGGFQEAPQHDTVKPYVKYSATITHLELIPTIIERAVRESLYGRPGPVYVDLPTELVHAVILQSDVTFKPRVPSPPRVLADPSMISSAVGLLTRASRPLVIVGKGAAYTRCEAPLHRFLSLTNIPYLPTPMGKGLVPDSHPLNAAAARSHILAHADTVMIVGARLNWMLHFGSTGRFNANVKLIQIDISAEEIGNGRAVDVGLCGDAGAVIDQLNSAFEQHSPQFTNTDEWKQSIKAIVSKNNQSLEKLLSVSDSETINYYSAYGAIKQVLPADAVVVNEGANTMDIGRTVLNHQLPRSRLDAGTFATMGLGVGYALAAAVCHRDRSVVAIEGDSAFGFSAMDYETAVRYRIPVTFIVFNNSGVYHGSDDQQLLASDVNPMSTPVTSLSYHTRYDLIGQAFGQHGKGFHVERVSQLVPVLTEALAWRGGPSIVNVIISSQQGRRTQSHSWMNLSGDKKARSKL